MKRMVLLVVSGLCLGLFGLPLSASADANNFTIHNFISDQTLSRSDPQGELHIIEHIQVTFNDNNHGLLRAIPDSYRGHSLQLRVNKVTSDSGAPTHYTTYGTNGNTVLKIGDPNQTVTGAQEYTIDYTLRNVITFYNDHDELYWDINGDQWQQPFEKVSATVHLPAGLRLSLPPACYTGSFGATTQNCTITTPNDTIQVTTTAPLAAGETLTYTAGFEPGYFRPSSWYETAWEYHAPALKLLAPLLLLSGISVVWWWRRGRDPKGTGIIVPQYDAPDGLKPLQVGAISDFSVDDRDITATIIDLAIRGYVKIMETKKNHLLGKDTLQYTLTLINSDFAGLDPYEALIMAALFPAPQPNATADLTASKHKLYTTATTVRKNVETDLTRQGYFRSNPLSAGKVLAAGFSIAVIVVWLGGKYLGWPFATGLVAGGIVALIFSKFMSARTAKGVTAEEHIKGLKLYLEVAAKDRLEKLQGPNAVYAVEYTEPVRTVQLFEKLLPFAIVLGVEKQWAGQFESLYVTPPDWYSGNWTTFNAVYLATSLNSGIGQAVNQSFSAPRSSGGSGFGGGGFSGGGGGGGGGGGW